MVIRKFLIVLWMALFANELVNIWVFDLEPSKTMAIFSFLVSIYLLVRLFIAIMIVEQYIKQHGDNNGKMG